MLSPEAVKALEKQLEEAGDKLRQPPSSLDELLPLLDKIESCLSKVEQSPVKSTHAALSPLMKALVSGELLKHSDTDVKVAVASCISEVTRITAPDAPYDDDTMKEVFQLIVSAFENLADKSSRSYKKRALILETVAKVRSCVIMLDLECDTLITEMFQIFFKAIRDNHPDSIFTSMETIMTLVLDESEDVSTELLTVLLSSTKIDNEDVLPIARKLGEKVFEKCAIKLKPYLTQVIKDSNISLDDYCKVVTHVVEGTIEQHIDDESKEQQEGKDGTEDGDPATNKSPKPSVSNGKKFDTDETSKDEVPESESDDDDSGDENSVVSESKKMMRNNSSSAKSKKSDDGEESASATELEKEEMSENGANASHSPSPSEGVADENLRKKSVTGTPKKKDEVVPVKKITTSSQKNTKPKPQKRSGKKVYQTILKSKVGSSKNEDNSSSDSEAIPLKQMSKKFEASDSDEDNLLIKKKEDVKKRGRGKASMEKKSTKSSTKNDFKDVSSPKSPTESDHVDEPRSRRKRTSGKDKASVTKEYGESLVGSKVKVWWPNDRMFYEGVIDSYDSNKKKHKVSYNDGDEEILNLKKERWEFINDDETDDVDEAEPASTDAFEMNRKKRTKKSGVDEVSPKGKMKGTATKSGKKADDDSSDDEIIIKSKAVGRKSASKTPKTKPKQDTIIKTASKSSNVKAKGKTPQSGAHKFSSNGGGGKMKSVKTSEEVEAEAEEEEEEEEEEEGSDESMGSPEAEEEEADPPKRKRETDTKSSKKRQKGSGVSVKG